MTRGRDDEIDDGLQAVRDIRDVVHAVGWGTRTFPGRTQYSAARDQVRREHRRRVQHLIGAELVLHVQLSHIFEIGTESMIIVRTTLQCPRTG